MIFSNLLNRHERCFGITLWRHKQTNVEIWFCPPGYRIKQHSHPNENIELMFIMGCATFYRQRIGYGVSMLEQFTPKWYHMFKRFTVKAGQLHWFSVSSTPLIFINIATFTVGNKPTSAAVDFKL